MPNSTRTSPRSRAASSPRSRKAKEVRPLVEKCITIARRALWPRMRPANSAPTPIAAATIGRPGARAITGANGTQAIAPSVAARRRCLQLLGDKQAVSVLFDEVAPRFADRPGGYTRILRLAKPRLGDAGTRAILEFVGVRDRVVERSVRPTFEGEARASSRQKEEARQSVVRSLREQIALL